MQRAYKDEDLKPGLALPLMEDFYTIQGEGFHQGKAAYFIRLGGCDVGCHWCDVKESWDASRFPLIMPHEIADKAAGFPARIAVVTGGEPLQHNLDGLTDALHAKDFLTHIETSGAFTLSGEWDWICLSPKKFKEPLPEIFPLAQELKVIVYNKSDISWAESLAAKVSNACHLYLQPEWSKQNQMLPVMVEYIRNNPQWRISLQIHKYMNIP